MEAQTQTSVAVEVNRPVRIVKNVDGRQFPAANVDRTVRTQTRTKRRHQHLKETFRIRTKKRGIIREMCTFPEVVKFFLTTYSITEVIAYAFTQVTSYRQSSGIFPNGICTGTLR